MTNSDFSAGPIISKSFATISQHINFFSLLAIIFIVVISVLGYFVVPDTISNSNRLLSIFIGIGFIGLYSKFAVMVHRAVILDEYRVSNIFKWSKNDSSFMLWMFVAISVMAAVVFSVSIFAGLSGGSLPVTFFPVLMFAGLIGVTIIASRLVIIFPSVATDKRLSIAEAWETTRYNKGSMFLLVIGLPYFTNKALNYMPEDSFLWVLIGTSLAVFITILEIVIVSYCFSELTNDEIMVDPDE